LLKTVSIAAVFALSAASCTTGFFSTGDDAIAELAASVSAYDVSRTIDDASDAEAGLEPSLSVAAGQADDAVARGLEEYGPSVRTVEDLGDGTERITRTWTRWNGVAMKSVAVRMIKPASDDARWASGDIVDEDATETLYAGDLVNPVSEASLTITWKNEAGTVFVYSVLRDGERIRVNGDFVRTFTMWDADHRVVSRRVEYLRIGQTVSARTIDYSYAYTGDAVVPSEIRMEIEGADGYALILSVADPRIVEWYRDLDGDGDHELALRIEKVRNPVTRELEITRTSYAADGSVAGTSTVSARVVVEEGQIRVVRPRANGSVYRVVVTETADGYTVDRNGTIYDVSIAESGSLTITGPNGSWLAEQDSSGAWVVTPAS
jgi:hypothetical protein